MTTGNLGVGWEGSQTEGQEPGESGNKQWYDSEERMNWVRNVFSIIWDVLYYKIKNHYLHFFLLSVAFGVAHQAVEEVSPGGDTILVQG